MKILRDNYLNCKIKLPMTLVLLFIILLGVCGKIDQIMKNKENKKEQTFKSCVLEG